MKAVRVLLPRDERRKTILRGAAHAFAVAGYTATSMDDVEAATGLGRASLYAAFKSKHQIYLLALNRYDSNQAESLIQSMAAEPTGRKASFRQSYRL